jgi:uncharacterized protein DUF6458
MKTATSLTVIAIGAILAFAVTSSPSFLNLQAVGWILILTGVCGLLLGQRSRDWLRRTIIVRNGPVAARTRRRNTRSIAAGLPAAPAAAAPSATPAAAPPAPAAPPVGETSFTETSYTQPIEQDSFEEYIEQ